MGDYEEEVGVRLTIDGQEVFSGKAKAAQESIKGIGDEADRTNAKTRAAGDGLDVFSGHASGLADAAMFATKVLGYTALGLGAVATAAAGFGLVTYSSVQQANVTFSSLLGSASAAKTFTTQLQDLSDTSSLSFSTLATLSQQLLGFGFQAKQIIPTIKALEDASAGLGSGTAGVQSMAATMGKLQGSIRVSPGDINTLVSQGVPAWQMLATAAHKSIAQVQLDASRGLIPSDAAVQVILNGIETKYGGMSAKLSGTLRGQALILFHKTEDDLATAVTPLATLLQRDMPTLERYAGDATSFFSRILASTITGVQALANAYKLNGIDGVLNKLGQWTGTGTVFSILWHNIRNDSEDIGQILKNSVFPGISDVVRIMGPTFLLALGTVQSILSWMSNHPTAARVIFDGIAVSIISYKLVNLITGVTDAIVLLGTKLLSTGAAALTFGQEMAAGTSLGDAADAGSAAGTAAKAGAAGSSVLGTVGKYTGLAYLGYEGGKALNSFMNSDSSIFDFLNGGGNSDAAAQQQMQLYNQAHGISNGPVGPPSVSPTLSLNGSSLPHQAAGGQTVSPGLSWVGENGPELMQMQRGAKIIPLDKKAGTMAGVVFQDGAVRVSGTDVLNAQAVADAVVKQIQNKIARS